MKLYHNGSQYACPVHCSLYLQFPVVVVTPIPVRPIRFRKSNTLPGVSFRRAFNTSAAAPAPGDDFQLINLYRALHMWYNNIQYNSVPF